MDQIKTGALIRTLRTGLGFTQRALAEKLCVSDKAVSKWERGCGTPDPALIPLLAETLGVSADALLCGELAANPAANGDLRKLRFCVCPTCGNLLTATDGAELRCCGRPLSPLTAKTPDDAHTLEVTESDGDWFVTAAHPMERGHYISFLAFLTGDTLLLKRLYPEWMLAARLPRHAHGMLLWYCTEHGLFRKRI